MFINHCQIYLFLVTVFFGGGGGRTVHVGVIMLYSYMLILNPVKITVRAFQLLNLLKCLYISIIKSKAVGLQYNHHLI
jgi:hypothetical protein